ncbi:hypothetical protein E4U28_000374 [Claviceps purpurea]|nr:hypothetical protein E4U28_000374 [Claviceps purpurea]
MSPHAQPIRNRIEIRREESCAQDESTLIDATSLEQQTMGFNGKVTSMVEGGTTGGCWTTELCLIARKNAFGMGVGRETGET